MNESASPNQQYQEKLASEAKEATKVTVIGMILDAALGIIKIIAGVMFHSQALVVDGIHSFSDVASDVVVLGAMHISRQEPDEDHPYGHQRIETFGTLLLGSILIAVGAALAWENVLHLFVDDVSSAPGWPVLVAAGISVISKEWIYRYTRRVGLAIRSDLIIANAWHSRTDALSSVVVLFSTVGAMLGFFWLDILAAVIIAAIIIHIGWKFTWDSVKELVDTGLSLEDIAMLKNVARNTEGVLNVHDLRSRRMGQDILLDIHLVVRPEISVSEGHQIGMHVVEGMRNALENIRYITFHIDAELDEIYLLAPERLPSRKDIRELMAQHINALPPDTRLRLHYLGNRIHLELFFNDSPEDDSLTSDYIAEQLKEYAWFGSAKVWIAGR